MTNHPPTPRHYRDGEIVGWVILQEDGQACMQCDTREQARAAAGKDGDIGKIVKEH